MVTPSKATPNGSQSFQDTGPGVGGWRSARSVDRRKRKNAPKAMAPPIHSLRRGEGGSVGAGGETAMERKAAIPTATAQSVMVNPSAQFPLRKENPATPPKVRTRARAAPSGVGEITQYVALRQMQVASKGSMGGYSLNSLRFQC